MAPYLRYIRDMPDLSLKGLDESLMRAVKSRAAGDGLTLRDWVIKSLARRVGWEADAGPRESSGIVETEAPVKTSGSRPATSGADCQICGKRMFDFGAMWCCKGCGRNFPK